MAQIIEGDDEGNIFLPRGVLGRTKPHTRYQVDVDGNTVILHRLEGEQALVDDAHEWARSFFHWLSRPRPTAPILPDEALRRESIYD